MIQCIILSLQKYIIIFISIVMFLSSVFFMSKNIIWAQRQELIDSKIEFPILSVEEKQEISIRQLDLNSDISITRYVDPDISYLEAWYIPEDMRILNREYISDTKGNAQMREEAASAFENMAEEFYSEFEEKLVVVSSYRSYAYQAGIKARGCSDLFCAKAGHSEHQSGLTADLWSASSQEYWESSERLMRFYVWLSENAYLYGFHNPYQNGRDIDGYAIEPWHWRYMWTQLATYLQDKDITFAEFYYSKW